MLVGSKVKGGKVGEWGSMARKIESRTRRATVKAAAIAEALEDLLPSPEEIDHEFSEHMDAELEEILVKSEPCGSCGGFCYPWEAKGEPCSMFVTVRGPDGILRGPLDWEFPE